ncbi:MAG: DUF1579 family protein [Planctomycetota bacterium]|jgi:hypothetical protein
MKNPKLWCIAALLGCVCFLVGNVTAQEEGGKKPAAGMGAMPEHMKLTQEHADLKKMVGQWDSSWEWTLPMPMKGTGTATTKLILGGRFIRQDYESEMMGQPWQGVLHLGYDTIEKEFVSVWMDSGSPIMSVSRGKRQADGSIKLIGMDPDHMTGKKHKVAVVTRWVNDNQYTVAFYTVSAEGKETQVGLMTYTRK